MTKPFKIVFSLIVLAVLLVVADRLAARVAGQVVADRIKDSQQLTTTPKVTIDGFPFLTQLVNGTYDQVDASAVDLHRADARASSVSLHLYGVHLSLSDVLSKKTTAIPVDRATGTVVLSYADINALTKSSGVTVAAAGDGAVTVSGSVTVAGEKVKGSGTGTLEPTDKGILVTLTHLRSPGLSATVTRLLVSKLSFLIPTTDLPFGISVGTVDATASGVSVSATLSAFTIPVS